MDFPKELIMGDDFIPLCKPSIRRLISCQSNVVSNYLVKGECLFTHYRINEKIARLDQNWDKLLKDQRETILNKINEDSTKLLLSTEKGCRKLRTGAVDYSPLLSKLGLRWRF